MLGGAYGHDGVCVIICLVCNFRSMGDVGRWMEPGMCDNGRLERYRGLRSGRGLNPANN